MIVRQLQSRNEIGQSGFTLIELLIATTIFSVILLVATAGVIRIGQLYYKGVTENRTQETARNVSEELTRSIQFTNGSRTNGSVPTKFCVGDTRYTVIENKIVDNGIPITDSGFYNQGIVAERIGVDSDCQMTPNSTDTTKSKQLLGDGMRVLKFNVSPVGDDTWAIDIRIAYGENDLLDIYETDGITRTAKLVEDGNCRTGISGSSFCATARLDTVVKKRVL